MGIIDIRISTKERFFVVRNSNAWFNQKYMSGDHQVNYNKINSNSSPNSRVNINDLISRVRDDEKKQKKENLVFFGLVVSVLAVTGIIASL